MARCPKNTVHAAHDGCEGRVQCVVCRKPAWVSETVVVRELRAHNGKRRHAGCRF